ncbi:probable potassium transporter 11 isoform X2 [Zea mays]|uniref:Potassium transporter n=1 Tax=Zea mays TaxID=4577 RepID=A0A804RM86_MAIZE|nr:probable potassium transporter 11 isoform X2 [Zea mays]|eukprot:XP_008663583.1 probable potassium transporter 11 isoform X2 [Zea mays]
MASLSESELTNRGTMWELDQNLDQPMDEEAGRLKNMYREKFSSALLLRLAFQSLGVVFGDLGTSPLYVFYNIFPRGIGEGEDEDVIGALSLIIYTLTLIPLLKYVFVVLRANDNGQGGTFALYSLLCRHAKINTIPNQHRTDEELTTYSRQTYEENSVAAKIKRWIESHAYKRNILLILVLIGTCTAIGDGILTPAISVLSASGGIKVQNQNMSTDVVVLVAVVILIGLFSMQHYGTDKVGWLFAPIVLLWFILIGSVGAINIHKYDSSVLKAYNPMYIYRFFRRRKNSDVWTSLGGIMLSITGTEALFADLCHFPVLAIQIAFTLIVFPCLLLAYTGQAAYIISNKTHVADAFYRSIPAAIYWPAFIIATAAAIVASQATISATYSIIKQALALGCFPRVKIVHTSKKFLGQIYIPDINWILLVLCIAVTAGFKNQSQIGNAYGTAVVIVMLVTTFLMVPIMLLVWKSHWILVVTFIVLSLMVEVPYFVACILKIDQGGWVPLVVATAFFLIMYVWHFCTVKRYEFEMHSKVSMAWILGLGPSLGLVRVPGIGFVYTELASGVPHIFSHFITNLPAIHSVVVFVCVKYLPVYTVPTEERFLVRRIGPRDFHMFRCVARYGYKDLHKRDEDFERMLFDCVLFFVRLESMMEGYSDSDEFSVPEQAPPGSGSGSGRGGPAAAFLQGGERTCSTMCSNGELSFSSQDSIVPAAQSPAPRGLRLLQCSASASASAGQAGSCGTVGDELEFLNRCKDAGVVHILGNTIVRARRDSGVVKKLAVDYMYAFMRRMCRENSVIFNVPHESLLNVGQIYYI